MKYLKNNESGYVFILSVVFLAGAILTSLSMSYIFTMNRIKYHARIKEAYKLVNVTESAGKTVRAAWDEALAANPLADFTTVAAGMTMSSFSSCSSSCSTSAPGSNMCFDNVDNASMPYCFTVNSAPNSLTQVQVQMTEKYANTKLNRFQKFALKLDRFFDREVPGKTKVISLDQLTVSKPTLVGWVFAEKSALADTAGGQTTTANRPPGQYGQTFSMTRTVVCNPSSAGSDPTNPSCMRCGGDGSSNCISVQASPAQFNGQSISQAFRIANIGDTK
jgi:hypothetical protein